MTSNVDAAARRDRSSALAVLRAARPRQWVKNVLVLAAPLAGGVVSERRIVTGSLVAFGVFTLASAGGYLLNDAHDAERDRMHPEKRHRPVASGAVTVATAVVVGVVLTVLAPVVALATDREALAVVVIAYSTLTVLYGVALKRIPGLELGFLSSGFVLRALAGAAATSIPPSPWFLAVCCLGAVTVAAGKRQVELHRLGSSARAHRPVLAAYTLRGLRRLRVGAALLMLACYVGWAMTRGTHLERVLALASTLPVGGAMLRLGVLNDRGEGDSPEVVALNDRVIQVAVLAWATVFLLGLGHV